jgi:hypothetical protein
VTSEKLEMVLRGRAVRKGVLVEVVSGRGNEVLGWVVKEIVHTDRIWT